MIVTDLIELNKTRYKVYIDQEFAFVLYKGELRIYKVRIGEEISEDVYLELLEKILPKRAKLRAMNLLQNKNYSERQMREKLSLGFYPTEVIDTAISYVKSFGYINDDKYAHDYYEYYKTSRGKQRIKQDLFKKGIAKEIVQDIFDHTNEWDDAKLEEQLILELLNKKKYDSKTASMKDKKKIYEFLMRKGFTNSSIKRVLCIYNAEC